MRERGECRGVCSQAAHSSTRYRSGGGVKGDLGSLDRLAAKCTGRGGGSGMDGVDATQSLIAQCASSAGFVLLSLIAISYSCVS